MAGERIVQNIEVKINMDITVPNRTNSIKQDMTVGEKYALNVLKADPDGGHEVELEFLSMRMKMEQGGKTMMDYDSTEKPSNDRKDPALVQIEQAFHNVIGAKIQFFLDASNQVERIEGADDLTARFAAGGRAGSDAGIQSMFNQETLKQMISGQHLPPKPVQPGDTWPVQMDLAMGQLGTVSIVYTFTMAGWEMHGTRNCARLEFQGTMKSKADTSSLPGRMSMSIQDGDSSGVSWFDPELGLVIDTRMDQNLTMNMSIPITVRGKKTAQTMATVMKQAINVKLDSVK